MEPYFHLFLSSHIKHLADKLASIVICAKSKLFLLSPLTPPKAKSLLPTLQISSITFLLNPLHKLPQYSYIKRAMSLRASFCYEILEPPDIV